MEPFTAFIRQHSNTAILLVIIEREGYKRVDNRRSYLIRYKWDNGSKRVGGRSRHCEGGVEKVDALSSPIF